MTPEQAFLVAISEAPQDDTPRLVYADWLEEHNQRDRAEFIRVQCQLAAMGEVKCERTGKPLTAYGEFTDRCRCSSCKVKRREYLCSRRHIEWEWTPEPVIGVYHIFRRGFIASITLASDAFLQHAADIIEAVPMLEDVRLSDKHPFLFYPGLRAESCGWLSGDADDPYSLPDCLFFRLRGGEELVADDEWPMARRIYAPDGPCAHYLVEDSVQANGAALDDLSHAAIVFAREQLADRNRLVSVCVPT